MIARSMSVQCIVSSQQPGVGFLNRFWTSDTVITNLDWWRDAAWRIGMNYGMCVKRRRS